MLLTRCVLIFGDLPEMRRIRQEHGAAHLDYLRRHQDRILISGLREAPGEAFVGGLWVLETDSHEEAVRLIEEDPDCKLGWRRYGLLVWSKALDEVAVTL